MKKKEGTATDVDKPLKFLPIRNARENACCLRHVLLQQRRTYRPHLDLQCETRPSSAPKDQNRKTEDLDGFTDTLRKSLTSKNTLTEVRTIDLTVISPGNTFNSLP